MTRHTLLLAFVIGACVVFPGVFGVEPRDYEEALKEDEPLDTPQGQESVTEYPNGVNVIPGHADIHYPIYDRIPKSSFSCAGRIPGFYADTDLRCQVWHICDEGGILQSFLCTNGTIYSQEKRVCDWWYNVNCDPAEVSRNYEANKDLYKGPPPREGSAYEESNDLPPPSPPKKQSFQEAKPQHSNNRTPVRYEEPRPQPVEQSYQNQNYQQQRAQNHRPQESQNYQHQIQSNRRNYEQSPPNPTVPQNTIVEPQQTPRRQPGPSSQNNNYVAPTQPTPTHQPEKKRVIVLRLPGPLPQGASIPPELLMKYAESVLAAEREGKPPPPGLVFSKQVPISSGHHQRPNVVPSSPQPSRATTPPPQSRPQPTQSPQQDDPRSETTSAKPMFIRGVPLPYTPRPFSVFLEESVRYNGQGNSKLPPPPSQNHQPPPPSQPQPTQSQRAHHTEATRRPPPPPPPPTPTPQRYTEPPTRNPPSRQQNFERRPEVYQDAPQQHTPSPSPQKKVPPPQTKPTKEFLQQENAKKFRHSTPRKHGEVKFAPKSAVAFEDLEDERQFPEESRRPAYPYQFNNFQAVPHLSESASRAVDTQTYNTPAPQPKSDVHLKTSFEYSGKEQQVKRKRVKVQVQETTTTTERYLTPDEIIEPAIKRLVVAAGLKIKDPRNRQVSVSSSPSSKSNSEEQIHRGNNYEAVKVIVARKSTTTAAPEAGHLDVSTSHVPQTQDHSTAATARPVVTRRVLRKKIRVNKNNAAAAATSTESPRYESTYQPQRSSTPELFQKVSNEPTSAPPTRPSTTVRTTKRTTLRTTSTTPYYESDDYYEPTRPIKNYGFDVFGRNEDDDEEEVLARAAQEYYQASELFGRKQRN